MCANQKAGNFVQYPTGAVEAIFKRTIATMIIFYLYDISFGINNTTKYAFHCCM